MAGWFAGAAVAIAAVFGLAHSHQHGATAAGTREHHYATTRGERATILLPDGSSALLGYASTLIVPADFGRTTRHVVVTGQAAFTVTPDRRAPFLVSVGDALTEVLGTSFVVQKYSTDAATRVAVTEGRVSLRLLETRNGHRAPDSTAAVLVAGMMGQVSDSGRMTIAPASITENFADWTLGRLSFRATPLREVVPTLERVYDVDIEIADSALLDHHVTLAAMPDKTPIAETLDLVTDVIGAHVTRSGRVFVIVPGKRATVLPRTRTSPFTPETQYGR
jgi:transmembrane sensor